MPHPVSSTNNGGGPCRAAGGKGFKVVSTVQVRKRTYQLQAEISAVPGQAQFLSQMALQHVVDLDDTALSMTKASPTATRRVRVVGGLKI